MKAEECGGQVCWTEEMDYSAASKNKSLRQGSRKRGKGTLQKKKRRDERKKKRVQIVIPTTVSASVPVGIGISGANCPSWLTQHALMDPLIPCNLLNLSFYLCCLGHDTLEPMTLKLLFCSSRPSLFALPMLILRDDRWISGFSSLVCVGIKCWWRGQS
jgi:hypothetical protein